VELTGCGGSREGYCADCIPGQYADAPSSSCIQCPGGQYSTATNAAVCEQCPAAQYQNEQGKAFCVQKQPGNRLVTVQGTDGTTLEVEEICPAGTFSRADAEDESACEECPRATVQKLAGQGVCDQCSVSQYVLLALSNGTVVSNRTECVDCPAIGLSCNGESKVYTGDVWHDVSILNPDSSTKLYTCVTDGCPAAGATAMECGVGYDPHSPLCAVCTDSYLLQIRKCAKCDEPNVTGIVIFVLVLLLLAATGAYFLP
jgi:hypothetical protein